MQLTKQNAERALKHFRDLSFVDYVHEFLKSCVAGLPSDPAQANRDRLTAEATALAGRLEDEQMCEPG